MLRHGRAVLRPRSRGRGRRPTSGKGGPKAKRAPRLQSLALGPREGSKAAKVLALLRRPDGATLKELRKATGCQAHSLQGFLSGTVAKRMRLKLVFAKSGDGERRYSIQG